MIVWIVEHFYGGSTNPECDADAPEGWFVQDVAGTLSDALGCIFGAQGVESITATEGDVVMVEAAEVKYRITPRAALGSQTGIREPDGWWVGR